MRCEICDSNTARYKCPRCLIQSCSVPCVKRHKTDTGCDGKRDKTAYVPLRDFSHLHLLSDYHLLEDAARKAESSRRDSSIHRFDRPAFLQHLLKQARKRGISYRLLPYPMSRRRQNKTMFHIQSQTILWQVDWLFPQADAKYTERRISENESLAKCLEQFISPRMAEPVRQHKLRCYCDAGQGQCGLFMKVEGRSAASVRYYRFSLEKSLKENLCGKTLIEYPTIHVVLSQHWGEYPSLDGDLGNKE